MQWVGGRGRGTYCPGLGLNSEEPANNLQRRNRLKIRIQAVQCQCLFCINLLVTISLTYTKDISSTCDGRKVRIISKMEDA